MLRLASLLAAALSLSGCLSTSGIKTVDDPAKLQAISAQQGLERDRQAILAMQGEYEVTFAFDETDPAPGYEPKPPKRSGAFELVLVEEDNGKDIILQHLLVHRTMGFVIKHWRQDWHYEAPTRLVFTDDQTWRREAIPAELTAGAWTQCVYEVSDAPRYCGTGKWTYDSGEPLWTSDPGWRPLPRREYSTRSDYNAVGMVNRHRITRDGWLHEQDNRKVVREHGKEVATLVQEHGVNTYKRIEGFNFNSGYLYWNDNSRDYWKRIRAEWQRRADMNDGIRLLYPIDGMDMIWKMYWQSEAARQGNREVGTDEIVELFEPWVAAP